MFVCVFFLALLCVVLLLSRGPFCVGTRGHNHPSNTIENKYFVKEQTTKMTRK